jgi:hypothetical protein
MCEICDAVIANIRNIGERLTVKQSQCFDVYYPEKPGARVASVYADECRTKEVNGDRNFTFVRSGEIIARFRGVRVYDESGSEVTPQ